jgi:hypothetical protein
MTEETIEERTERVIAGVRRSNFEHSGNFYVYSITPSSTVENGYNKTLVIGEVSQSFAGIIRDRELKNKKSQKIFIEERGKEK